VTVCCTILRICCLLSSCVIGMPDTEAYWTRGTMVSPCSPMTSARTSSLDTFSSCAMYDRNRSVSRMLPMPKTRFLGKPDVLYAMYVIMSTGFVTIMSLQSGAYFATSLTTVLIMPAFLFMSSILVIPGFLPRPAITITTSEPRIWL